MRGFWSFFVAAIGFVAAVFEIISVAAGLLGTISLGWRVVLVITGALLLLAASRLAWETRRHMLSDRRFAREVPSHMLRLLRAAAVQPSGNSKTLRLQLEKIITQLSNLLTRVSGEEVRACIKVMDPVPQDPDRPHVRTLIRDQLFGDQTNFDERTKKRDVVHWIDKNTDYLILHENQGTADGEVFFENRLPRRLPYENTSFELSRRPPEPDDFPVRWLGYWMREFRWPLPYKSTVVVPIGDASGEIPGVLGYLAVDSRHTDTFDRDRDPLILQMMAQFIAPMIRAWRELEIAQTEKPA